MRFQCRSFVLRRYAHWCIFSSNVHFTTSGGNADGGKKANTGREIKSHWNEAHKNGCCVTLASYQLDKLTEMDFPFSLLTQKGAHQKKTLLLLGLLSRHSPTDLKKRLPWTLHFGSTLFSIHKWFFRNNLRLASWIGDSIPPVFCAWDIDLIFYARFCDNGDGSTKDAVKVKDKFSRWERAFLWSRENDTKKRLRRRVL